MRLVRIPSVLRACMCGLVCPVLAAAGRHTSEISHASVIRIGIPMSGVGHLRRRCLPRRRRLRTIKARGGREVRSVLIRSGRQGNGDK